MKLRQAKLGKKCSEETKEKMRLAHIGKKHRTSRKLSEERKKQIFKGLWS